MNETETLAEQSSTLAEQSSTLLVERAGTDGALYESNSRFCRDYRVFCCAADRRRTDR
jgi:hypothetical protein